MQADLFLNLKSNLINFKDKSSSKLLLLLASFFLILNVIFIFLFIHEKSLNNNFNPYPFIDISRNFISQENFIVNIQPLREELQKIVNEEGKNSISIYFEFLNTGANIQINNDLRFYPASLVKLPVALVTMSKIEKGEWHLDNRLILFEEDKDRRYGNLYKNPVGTQFTIEELLKALLINSDNTAHRILIRNLSEDELNKLKDELGLNDLFNEDEEISAKEYTRLFRSLYISSFLKKDASQQLLRWLSETSFNDFLASGIPPEIIFSHKIGIDDVEKNYLDSGIVYLPKRPYLLTVMIRGKEDQKAKELMSKISRITYEYVQNY